MQGRRKDLKIRECLYYLVGIILVEIRLTDLSKTGGAMELPAPHGNNTLEMYRVLQTF